MTKILASVSACALAASAMAISAFAEVTNGNTKDDSGKLFYTMDAMADYDVTAIYGVTFDLTWTDGGQGCGGGLDALAAVLHQLVGAGLPCGHGQAVGGFIPVAVKARADAQYIVGQEPDAQLYSVGGYGIIASAVLDSAAGVAHFHRFSPFYFAYN